MHSLNFHFTRSVEYDSKIQTIAESYQRLDELDNAIEWALMRGPDTFDMVAEDIYVWKMEKISASFPQLRICYRFTKTTGEIELLDVEEVPQ